jgi:copper(I)-binding protein
LKRAIALIMCGPALACSPPESAPLAISNVVVLEPLPGTSMTAGYLTVENNSDQPITIEKVTSPQFARVEMHETVIEDDVTRMMPLSPLIVSRHSNIVFEPGGKHLMMSGPPQEIAPGLPVTVEFHYDTSGLLIVATTVSSRDVVPD